MSGLHNVSDEMLAFEAQICCRLHGIYAWLQALPCLIESALLCGYYQVLQTSCLVAPVDTYFGHVRRLKDNLLTVRETPRQR